MARHGPVAGHRLPRLRSAVRPIAILVSDLFGGTSMRSTKIAIAAALASDTAVSDLVPDTQIYAVEKATIPALPAIEVIGISSQRQSNALVRHELSVECTVSHSDENGADKLLDSIVGAIRHRLSAAENSISPITLAGGANVLVSLESTRWSVSASVGAGVVRGASVALSVEASE